MSREDRVTWSSSCSRNAHDRNVLVRRAQSRINQATLENEIEEEEMGADDLLCSRNARPQKNEKERPGALVSGGGAFCINLKIVG